MADQRPQARSFLAAANDFDGGKNSPRQFLEDSLAIIEQREGDVLALTAINIEAARAAADASTQRWKEGKPLSLIDGMPVGIKDVIETIDMPTSMGSPLYDGYQSNRDSASVFALREAGAVVLAKTVTTEFAASEPGPTRNPWDTERTPGGSSSGSAAGVAAGYFSAALGTQVIGSILRPSSYCGVVGFKPSVGAINRGGSHDFMSQSAQGVLGASLEDCWQTAWEIAVRCGGDPGHPGLAGRADPPSQKPVERLIFLETAGWAEASEEAKHQMLGAIETLRASGIEILTRKENSGVEAAEQAVAEAMPVSRNINTWESRWPLNTYKARDAQKLSQAMGGRADEAQMMTPAEYRQTLLQRDTIRAAYAQLAHLADGCITLAASAAAPIGLRSTGSALFAVTSSALGVPSLSLPVLQEAGLPLGMQVMGFADKDAEAFTIARRIMENMPAEMGIRA